MNICAELRPRIVAFLDGELSDAAAATVASHLEACDACRAERQLIVATRELLSEIPAPAPDPAAWKRIRREIRPIPRVSRAWNAPIPMWAAGSMAAGFLGLAVIFSGGGSGGDAPTPVRPEGLGTPVAPSGDLDGRRAQPKAPGITDGHTPKIAGAASPATTPDAGVGLPVPTPPESGDAETAPASAEVESRPAAPQPLPAVDPAEEVAVEAKPSTTPAAPTPHSVPVAAPTIPNTPSVVQWESVTLQPYDAPSLPVTPAFMLEAKPFDPAVGLPVPRGQGLVQLHELENGDLVVDRGGDENPRHFFKILRRRALQNRKGVTFPLRVEYPGGHTALLTVSVLKRGDQWLFQNHTARRGKWGDRTVFVVDGDHDGRYDRAGVDAMVFSDRGEIVPVSDTLLTERGLIDCSVDELGGRFAVRPYTGPTGALQLEASYQGNGRATSVVVRSGDRYFEVARHAGKPIIVPAGTYTVATGMMVSKQARMKILTGASASVEVSAEADAPAVVALGGQCAMAYKLDGDPEQGMVSVALTSIAVHGQGGEIYEPIGRGLRMVSFVLRDGEGGLLKQQKASPTRCPKNGHERFGVKLPNSVARDDVSVQLFAPAYEKTFGSVTGTFPEKRR